MITLTEDIFYQVLSSISYTEIPKMFLVSKRYNKFCKSKKFWKEKIESQQPKIEDIVFFAENGYLFFLQQTIEKRFTDFESERIGNIVGMMILPRAEKFKQYKIVKYLVSRYNIRDCYLNLRSNKYKDCVIKNDINLLMSYYNDKTKHLFDYNFIKVRNELLALENLQVENIQSYDEIFILLVNSDSDLLNYFSSEILITFLSEIENRGFVDNKDIKMLFNPNNWIFDIRQTRYLGYWINKQNSGSGEKWKGLKLLSNILQEYYNSNHYLTNLFRY